ncbi:hypothetical protein EKO27_g7677 [Xylaria grammica]|uniref:Uncharacterized protein n=1 Tax=Xylaria grammica TaxID=363999 RepID=A0A439CYZ2_9PEZI|nr:hypothetical protein EKO27_g7677 [Xylaria grammica]
MKNFIRSKAGMIPVKLTNPAEEFVHNRVAVNGAEPIRSEAEEHHEDPVSSQSATAVSKDTVGADVHCKQFAEVLRSFEESLPDNLKTQFNLQKKHTWAEVVNEAHFAEIKYNKKADKESPFGRIRGFFRILRSNSPAITNWLDLLPTESEYGSLICGGFKLILRAATRMNEIKEFIVGAMAAIPDEVEKAQLLIEYNADQDVNRRLYNSVSSLYRTVFDILNDIIGWYKEKSLKRHGKAFLYQDAYEKNLETKVETFRTAVSSVRDEAEICGSRRLQTIDESTRESLDVLKKLELLLRSHPMVDYRTGQFRLDSLSMMQVPAPKGRAISRQSLCEAVLRYDEDVPRNDLAIIMHEGSGLSLTAQDRIVFIIESGALKAWLLGSKNGALLIRGSPEHVGSDTFAISFAAAHLVQSTQKAQRTSHIIGLFWFAKQHQNRRSDADANVHGVMRSLIGQLVHAYGNFDLHFIKRSHAVAIREDNDLKTLCDVFDNLVFQLPRKTITICVLDWLACLEYHEKHNVDYLVKRLLSIVRHSNENGSLFKLLLTHDGGAFWAASTFIERGDVLDVPEDGNGNGMGFTRLMWDANVDDRFKHLATRSIR